MITEPLASLADVFTSKLKVSPNFEPVSQKGLDHCGVDLTSVQTALEGTDLNAIAQVDIDVLPAFGDTSEATVSESSVPVQSKILRTSRALREGSDSGTYRYFRTAQISPAPRLDSRMRHS